MLSFFFSFFPFLKRKKKNSKWSISKAKIAISTMIPYPLLCHVVLTWALRVKLKSPSIIDDGNRFSYKSIFFFP